MATREKIPYKTMRGASRYWTEERILYAIARARRHLGGRYITSGEWTARRLAPSTSTIIGVFGSYTAAWERAGATWAPPKTPDDKRARAINTFREAGSMSSTEWMRRGFSPSLSTITTLFGSWAEFEKAAGMERQHYVTTSNAALFPKEFLAYLPELQERQRYIISQRVEGVTLDKIACELHLTRQRVQQLETVARGMLEGRYLREHGGVYPEGSEAYVDANS